MAGRPRRAGTADEPAHPLRCGRRLVGSLIGGLIAQLFGTGSICKLNILGLILAVVAAVLLIGVAEGILSKDKSHT